MKLKLSVNFNSDPWIKLGVGKVFFFLIKDFIYFRELAWGEGHKGREREEERTSSRLPARCRAQPHSLMITTCTKTRGWMLN